ncbi:unnamed protein product [Effrenium voratum]|nr:unnamed protein product [Effrenium voratum]
MRAAVYPSELWVRRPRALREFLDVGALSTEVVLKLLEDLNLAFQKGTLERHYVEAMVQDCHTDPARKHNERVEFLVSAVREFMVQCQRRTERELQAVSRGPRFRSQLIRFHEPRPKPPACVSFKELDDDDSGVLDPNEATGGHRAEIAGGRLNNLNCRNFLCSSAACCFQFLLLSFCFLLLLCFLLSLLLRLCFDPLADLMFGLVDTDPLQSEEDASVCQGGRDQSSHKLPNGDECGCSSGSLLTQGPCFAPASLEDVRRAVHGLLKVALQKERHALPRQLLLLPPQISEQSLQLLTRFLLVVRIALLVLLKRLNRANQASHLLQRSSLERTVATQQRSDKSLKRLKNATPRQQQLILFDFEGLPGVPHAAGSSCSSASSGREVSRPCSLSLIVVMMVRYGAPRQVLAATGSSKRALRLAAPPEDEVQLDLFLRLQEDWASLTSSCGQTMRLSESGTANLPMAKTIPAQLFTLPKPAHLCSEGSGAAAAATSC